MNDFSIACSLTNYPFNYNNKQAIIIPIVYHPRKEGEFHQKYNFSIFPGYLEARYSRDGIFDIYQNKYTNKILRGIKDIIENPFGCDELPIVSEMIWTEFFNAANKQKIPSTYHCGEITYLALHEKTFIKIINEYKDSDGYDFKEHLEHCNQDVNRGDMHCWESAVA